LKDSKIATLEAQRISLLHKLERVSEKNLNQDLRKGKWSILQVLEHVIVCEELSIQYAFRKITQPDSLERVGVKSKVLSKIVTLGLGLKLKHEAPSVTKPNSDRNTSLDTLRERWEISRDNLEELSIQSTGFLELGIGKHPSIGSMSFSQILAFFRAHYNHHLVQINTLFELAMANQDKNGSDKK